MLCVEPLLVGNTSILGPVHAELSKSYKAAFKHFRIRSSDLPANINKSCLFSPFLGAKVDVTIEKQTAGTVLG